MPQGRRKLAAIMFTDIVGYSSMMQEDETRGRMLRKRHRSVFEQCTAHHDGRIVQYYGDGTLSVFDSAVSAVECAVSMQQQLRTYPQVPLRIGIHLGDIHYDETEVYGHGVNIAARIEPLCNPGGIFLSGKVNDEISGHPWLKSASLGVFKFKNIEKDIELFAIEGKDVTFPDTGDVERARTQASRTGKSSAAERSEAIKRFARERRRKFYSRAGNWAALFLVVIMAGVAFARWSSSLTPEIEDDGRDAIAVLPFINMSASAENEYFSDGMTEDILTLLSKIEGLSVTSRTSVMQYKNTTKSTRKIARELGVDKILEGSVRRDGNQVRITAQLIDARNDSHLWANTYDADLTNIFEVQTQVAEDIAVELKHTLSDRDKSLFAQKKDFDVTAYDLYLKGRQYYRKYTKEDNDRAIAYFNSALEIEPDFAYAMAGLGDAYAQKAGHHGMHEGMLDTAVMMSARAIEANPELSEGYKSLGLAFHYQEKIDDAITQYEKALELDPYNDMASNNLGMIYKERGDFAAATKWASKTYEINKGVPNSAIAMADLYFAAGDYEAAEVIVDEGIDANPEYTDLQYMKGLIRLRENDPDAAIEHARYVIEEHPEMSKGYELQGNAYMRKHDWESAIVSFDRAIETAHKDSEKIIFRVNHRYASTRANHENPTEIVWDDIMDSLDLLEEKEYYKSIAAMVRAGIESSIDESDEAVKHLEIAAKEGGLEVYALNQHPMFEPIKNDPEVQKMIKDVELKNDSLRLIIEKVVTERSGS